MEKYISEKLREMYLEFGDDLFLDSRRLCAIMCDVFAEYSIERKKLTIVINENLVNQIVQDSKSRQIARGFLYAESLQKTYDIPKQTALELIDTFVYAVMGEHIIEKTMDELCDELQEGTFEGNLNKYIPRMVEEAGKGNDKVQFQLGKLYDYGTVVKQDLSTACKWYESAARNGNSWAANNLGVIYEKNLHDMDKAKYYYELAAQGNEICAIFNLGRLYEYESTFSERIGNLKKAETIFGKVIDIDCVFDDKRSSQLDIKNKFECLEKAVIDGIKIANEYQKKHDEIIDKNKINTSYCYQHLSKVEELISKIEKYNKIDDYYRKIVEEIQYHKNKLKTLSDERNSTIKEVHEMNRDLEIYIEKRNKYNKAKEEIIHKVKERYGVQPKELPIK